jgi:stress-induced-phosphoprotein 1
MVVDAKDAYEEALKVEPTNAQAKSGLKAVDEAIAREAAEDGQEPDLGIGKVIRSFRRQRLRVDVQ